MSPYLALSILGVYFLILIIISIITSRNANTDSFFIANKSVPWYLVAFGMIGTSISGVTFISLPGQVGPKSFSYFQMVLGFVMGYWFIATVLMPLYYRLNLISIYQYLQTRFGVASYKTGSAFFILSRTLGSAVRLYVAAKVLQIVIYDPLGVPFWLSTIFTITLIWVYTFKGGVKTIIITDTLQTFYLITALLFTIVLLSKQLNYDFGDVMAVIAESKYSRIFFFEGGWSDAKNFFKLFVSGAFIAIVMTGLDQDLMQKNLTCRNIADAQKNMKWFTVSLIFVNLLFLGLGALMYIYAETNNIILPVNTDDFYPTLALKTFTNPSFGLTGLLTGVTFLIGITAATYASSDSALTALTTAFSIDFMNVQSKPEAERLKIKNRVHIAFSIVFVIVILIFNALNSTDAISAIYQIASYTYGPLLGLFGIGIYSKLQIHDRFVPLVCVFSPILTFTLVQIIESKFNYKFGFENLLLNGVITAFGLWLVRKK